MLNESLREQYSDGKVGEDPTLREEVARVAPHRRHRYDRCPVRCRAVQEQDGDTDSRPRNEEKNSWPI